MNYLIIRVYYSLVSHLIKGDIDIKTVSLFLGKVCCFYLQYYCKRLKSGFQTALKCTAIHYKLK